jgi:hypothetical protein
MPLAAMQRCLTDLYGLDLEYAVDDFLITDRLLAGALGGGSRAVDEELLIVEQNGEANVSLFLEEQLLARLVENDPIEALTQENLADFWIAFEGVSHFTYFAFKASADQRVTLLEMELQAEVDKFIATALLLRLQGERPPRGLHRWLFDLPRLHEGLSTEEHERYRLANRYAARFCRQIWPALVGGTVEPLTRELRYFYRLPRERKMGHIEARRRGWQLAQTAA